MTRARGLWRTGAAVLLGGLLVASLGGAAQADSDDWQVTRYDVVADLQPDGAAVVTIDLDFDFGPDRGSHGPYLVVVERQEIEGDPDHYRLLEVSDVSVSSSTGAPTDLLVEREDGSVLVRVGDENTEIGGVHSYTLSYRLDALVAPGDSSDDVLWNAVGLGWEVPLSDVSVTLTAADGEATEAWCVAGGVGATTPCDGGAGGAGGSGGSSGSGEGGGVVFEQERLSPGQGLTVFAAYPAGTFPQAEVVYAPRRTFGNSFALTPLTAGLGGAVLLGGAGAVLAVRRGRRDAPESRPGSVTDRGLGGPVPEGFRTEPPLGVPPGEFGTLVDERAQTRDVVAVLLDLAVRGALHLEVIGPDGEDGDGDTDFELVRPEEPVDLRDYERELLETIFGGSTSVLMSERGEKIAAAVAAARTALDAEVTRNGWFVASPRRVRGAWLLAGGGLVVLGLVATLVLALTVGWGLVGLAVLALGIVVMSLAGAMPSRTAAGTALTREAHEFERYLRDVTATAPTWPAGRERLVPSVFEQYLPYAVALRLEKRWTDAFTAAVQRGELQQPAWFGSPGSTTFLVLWSSGAFSQSLTDLGGGFATAAAPAAAGSAGMSAGAGASGGGGGGW